MDEDGNPIEAPAEEVKETSTDNIPEFEGGETVTPEEIAEILHLPKAAAPEKEEEETPEEPETPEEESDTPEAPADPDKEEPEKLEEPKEEPTKTETPADQPKFELEVEDANGEKFTISELKDLPEDFVPKNNRQIMEILSGLQDVKNQKQAYEAEQATKTAEQEKAAQIAEIQKTWDSEIKAMQGAKRISVTTDGKQNERVDEVFKFMNEENAKREEDGRPLLRSFEDTLDKLELRETKAEAEKKAKEEKELARKKGAIVGGSSAPASNGAPVYKGGARNANEAIRAMGLI